MTATEHLPRTEATYQLHRCHISFWRGLWYKGHLSYPPKNSRVPRCTEQHISQVTHNSYNKAFIVLRPLPQNTMCCIEANYKNVFGSPDAPALDQISRLLHSQSGAPIPPRKCFIKRFTNALVAGFLSPESECSQCLSRATRRMCTLTNHSFGSLSSVGSNPLNSAPNGALTWVSSREAGINYIYYTMIEIPASVWNFYSSYRIFI